MSAWKKRKGWGGGELPRGIAERTQAGADLVEGGSAAGCSPFLSRLEVSPMKPSLTAVTAVALLSGCSPWKSELADTALAGGPDAVRPE